MDVSCSPKNNLGEKLSLVVKYMCRNKELSLPALELHPVAVELDTHRVVWVHDDLADECLHSLVKVSRQNHKVNKRQSSNLIFNSPSGCDNILPNQLMVRNIHILLDEVLK